MNEVQQTIRPLCAQASPVIESTLGRRIQAVVTSAPMNQLKTSLARAGSTVIPKPILHKYLERRYLRLMFPVDSAVISEGTVAAVVSLYDTEQEQVLYVHPMYAGPGVNPLLQHAHGPMAQPQSQEGINGELATLRLREHKKAIWEKFQQEKNTLGLSHASHNWRKRYYWALRRLYFCSRCTSCRWGNPAFDGPASKRPCEELIVDMDRLNLSIPETLQPLVTKVTSSQEWKIEANYVRRGEWSVSPVPWLIHSLGDAYCFLAFPTNAGVVQGGTIVAMGVYSHIPTQQIHYAQNLVAGPETEILFRYGESLGLPSIQDGAFKRQAVQEYMIWRQSAWNQYWMNELEKGLPIASLEWLKSFWMALENLQGGNQIQRPGLENVFGRLQSGEISAHFFRGYFDCA